MTIISANHKLVFVHTGKCGGSTVEHAFQKYVQWGDFVIGSTPEGEQILTQFRKLYGIHKHSSAAVIKEKLGAQASDYTFVSTVREPRRLVESWYKWAFDIAERHSANSQTSVEQIRERVRKLDADGVDTSHMALVFKMHGQFRQALMSSSFEDYLDRVVDDKWRNYLSRFLDDEQGHCLVDHIFKLEEIGELEAFFRQHLNQPDFALGHVNAGKKMSLTWPTAMLQKFYDLAEPEYLRFGYDMRY